MNDYQALWEYVKDMLRGDIQAHHQFMHLAQDDLDLLVREQSLVVYETVLGTMETQEQRQAKNPQLWAEFNEWQKNMNNDPHPENLPVSLTYFAEGFGIGSHDGTES